MSRVHTRMDARVWLSVCVDRSADCRRREEKGERQRRFINDLWGRAVAIDRSKVIVVLPGIMR